MFKPREQAQAAPAQINVVRNWFEELKLRALVAHKMGKLVRRMTLHPAWQTAFSPAVFSGQ